MSTVRTWQTESSSSDDTFAIGERLGLRCKGGEIFLLISDLGGGKTTLTKGLAKGLGSKAIVVSPTFTLSRIYQCRDGMFLHHFDFYRLHEGGIVAHELSEVLDDHMAIVVVEWGDVVSNVLPSEHIMLQLERQAHAVNTRLLSADYPEKFDYIFKD